MDTGLEISFSSDLMIVLMVKFMKMEEFNYDT